MDSSCCLGQAQEVTRRLGKMRNKQRQLTGSFLRETKEKEQEAKDEAEGTSLTAFRVTSGSSGKLKHLTT